MQLLGLAPRYAPRRCTACSHTAHSARVLHLPGARRHDTRTACRSTAHPPAQTFRGTRGVGCMSTSLGPWRSVWATHGSDANMCATDYSRCRRARSHVFNDGSKGVRHCNCLGTHSCKSGAGTTSTLCQVLTRSYVPFALARSSTVRDPVSSGFAEASLRTAAYHTSPLSSACAATSGSVRAPARCSYASASATSFNTREYGPVQRWRLRRGEDEVPRIQQRAAAVAHAA